MTTQLRLVDPPPPIEPAPIEQARRKAAKAAPKPKTTGKPKSASAQSAPGRARVANRSRSASRSIGRRAARWGEWQLDDRTRSVGRAGVAAAREALQQVSLPESLRRAS